MAKYAETRWCDGCGVEITWTPVLLGNRIYCCVDCQKGLRCDCAARLEREDDRRPAEQALPVSDYG
jgi:hypothetical protein